MTRTVEADLVEAFWYEAHSSSSLRCGGSTRFCCVKPGSIHPATYPPGLLIVQTVNSVSRVGPMPEESLR